MRRSIALSCSLLVAWLVGFPNPATAQILIWSLPKDGAWVRFEGNYRQTRARPNNNAGDEILEWRNELSIGSVGSENVSIDGKSTPCRWVEFKTVTKAPDVEQQAGPGGTHFYKVLIPENRVTGKIEDDGIPITFLPIVKGYRRVGTREPEAVTERALAVYPVIAPLTYYANLKPANEASVELALPFANKPISAQVWKGSRLLENSTVRSMNSATLWRTSDVPFGLARFQVTTSREEKDPDAPADAFRRTSLLEIEMSAVAVGNDARSELPDSR